MSILITGATGFIGRAVLAPLLATGAKIRIAGRHCPASLPEFACFSHLDLASLTLAEAKKLTAGVSTVLHLAGYAHAMRDADATLHHRVNRDATILLAQAAAQHGARFVTLSSVKAENPASDDAYGQAKAEADHTIAALSGNHVILRPALVIAEGASGNLARLVSLAKLPLPLPFASVDAPRSMISREDVVALVLRAMTDTALLGQRVTLADPAPISLCESISALRAGMGRSPGLFIVPPRLLHGVMRLLGKSAEAERLLTPSVFVPDVLLALGWRPALPVRLALKAVGAAHHSG